MLHTKEFLSRRNTDLDQNGILRRHNNESSLGMGKAFSPIETRAQMKMYAFVLLAFFCISLGNYFGNCDAHILPIRTDMEKY